MLGWLAEENSQIAIFDATNTTEERRRFLIQKFHGHFSYMFIESICNDVKVLEEVRQSHIHIHTFTEQVKLLYSLPYVQNNGTRRGTSASPFSRPTSLPLL
jgi:hypothetical protein